MRLQASFLTASLFASSAIAQSRDDTHEWWANVESKAGFVALNPKDGATTPIATSLALASSDGKRVAYLVTPEGSKFANLFVADVSDLKDPDGTQTRPHATQLTKGFPGICQIQWLADGSAIVFMCTETRQVYSVRTASKGGVMPRPTQISDGSGPCSMPTPSPDGRIAWFVERSREGKSQYSDLMITTTGGPLDPLPAERAQAESEPPSKEPRSGPKAQTVSAPPAPPTLPPTRAAKVDADVTPLKAVALVKGLHLFSMQFSPNGKKLAYGPITELRIHDFESRQTRTIELPQISDKLYAHYPSHLAWRPDSKAIAATFTFAGGRAVVQTDDPNAPRQKSSMLGDAELFFVPVDPARKAWWVEAPEIMSHIGWIKTADLPTRAKP